MKNDQIHTKKTPLIKLILTILSLLIILSLVIIPFASKGQRQTPTTTTEKPDPENNTPLSQLDGFVPEDNYVEFLYVEGGNDTYTADSIWVDPNSIDLDSVDNKIIERNNKIKEVLGVDIYSFTNASLGIGDLLTEAQTYFDNQLDTLDVYCGYQYYDLSVATTGNLVNLNTLVNDKDEKLIDIEQSYWATDYIKSITYNDLLYWVTGDLSLRYTGGMCYTFVNSAIYDKAIKDAYAQRTIYEIVEDGEWTMETMLQMAELAFTTVNTKETAPEDMIYGILYEKSTLDCFPFGCNVSLGEKSNNTVTVTIQKDETAAELAGYLRTMITSTYAKEIDSHASPNAMSLFADGKALFTFGPLFWAAEYTDMHDLIIVPLPKLNTAQTEYATGVHESVTVFGIFKYSNCKNTAAATLELMSYYSAQLVTDMFTTHLLHGVCPHCSTETTGRTKKLVEQNVNVDFVSAWSHRLSDVSRIFRDVNNSESNELHSIPQQLAVLLAQLEEANE